MVTARRMLLGVLAAASAADPLAGPTPLVPPILGPGFVYAPHCTDGSSANRPAHIERDGDGYRVCSREIEMQTSTPMDLAGRAPSIRRTCTNPGEEWTVAVCGSLVSVRIDFEWESLLKSGWKENEITLVEYPELFGRSAQRMEHGWRHREVDLLFLHAWRRAHIAYVAPIGCADQIDEMIAHAHVPFTIREGGFVPLASVPL